MTTKQPTEALMEMSKSSPTTSSQTQQLTNLATFMLQPDGDLVPIPEDMFIWSNFLREYKKGMLVDNNGTKGNEGVDYIIPLPPIRGQPVQRAHLEKVYEFFQLFYRHTYGSGSRATKKVHSSADVRSMNASSSSNNNNQKCCTTKQGAGRSKDDSTLVPFSTESTLSEAHIALIEKRSNAKWSKLPDWAHGWFSAHEKNLLIGAANVANFLTATPFVELYSLFVAIKLREMDNEKQIMAYLNIPIDNDDDSMELKKLLYGHI